MCTLVGVSFRRWMARGGGKGRGGKRMKTFAACQSASRLQQQQQQQLATFNVLIVNCCWCCWWWTNRHTAAAANTLTIISISIIVRLWQLLWGSFTGGFRGLKFGFWGFRGRRSVLCVLCGYHRSTLFFSFSFSWWLSFHLHLFFCLLLLSSIYLRSKNSLASLKTKSLVSSSILEEREGERERELNGANDGRCCCCCCFVISFMGCLMMCTVCSVCMCVWGCVCTRLWLGNLCQQSCFNHLSCLSVWESPINSGERLLMSVSAVYVCVCLCRLRCR